MLVEWLKVKALSSRHSTAKTKQKYKKKILTKGNDYGNWEYKLVQPQWKPVWMFL
jgi:hypothetical protein